MWVASTTLKELRWFFDRAGSLKVMTRMWEAKDRKEKIDEQWI